MTSNTFKQFAVTIDDLLNDTQAVFSLLVCANGSRLPASSEQVNNLKLLSYKVLIFWHR